MGSASGSTTTCCGGRRSVPEGMGPGKRRAASAAGGNSQALAGHDDGVPKAVVADDPVDDGPGVAVSGERSRDAPDGVAALHEVRLWRGPGPRPAGEGPDADHRGDAKRADPAPPNTRSSHAWSMIEHPFDCQAPIEHMFASTSGRC